MTVVEKIEQSNNELIRMGLNFLGILNDIKRRPEDAANELGVSLDEINDIIQGKQELSETLVSKATKIWPVNKRDFYLIQDDCQNGVSIMTAVQSKKSSRVMHRAGHPYYEYRDTAMSSVAPFRPEWIMELCYVDDNEPDNKSIQWNNGHFMHQFTYFIGDVNFYYMGEDGEKRISKMKTGDSMYITPFVPHTFATRKGASENGLILALTYGNKLTGDAQHELSALNTDLGSEFVLDFTTKDNSIKSLLKFYCEITSITLDELAKRTKIDKTRLANFETGIEKPTMTDYEVLADALSVNVRDLLPNDSTEEKVIVKHHKDSKSWFFPEATNAYELIELALTKNLPHSRAFEVNILNSVDSSLDLKIGLHQYGYNVGKTDIEINWEIFGEINNKTIHPGDSFYIKPFIPHNFRGEGKLLILRVGGKIVGDPQRELSFVGKQDVKRAISETMQWFETEGKN